MVVEVFPLTSSGKIDRQALALLDSGIVFDLHALDATSREINPQGGDVRCIALEEHIARVVLQCSGRSLRPKSSFAALGVDSLSSILFLRALSDSFSGAVDMQLIHSIYSPDTTLADFASKLHAHLVTKAPSAMQNAGISPLLSTTNDISEPFESDVECRLLAVMTCNVRIIQGLRGFLAFMVLYDHFRPPGVPFSQAFLADASLFVILSGFTTGLQLTGALEWDIDSDSIKSRAIITLRNDTFDWRQFLISRAIGIFPILWLTLIICAPRWWLQNNPLAADPNPHIINNAPAPELSSATVGTCAFLYTIGMDTYYRPHCLASGPKDTYYGGALWNVFLYFCCLRQFTLAIFRKLGGAFTIHPYFTALHSSEPSTVSETIFSVAIHGGLVAAFVALGSIGGGNFTGLTFFPYFLGGMVLSHLFRQLCLQLKLEPNR